MRDEHELLPRPVGGVSHLVHVVSGQNQRALELVARTESQCRRGVQRLTVRQDQRVVESDERQRDVGEVRPRSHTADTFDLGRDELQLAQETSIGLYSQERCIIDSFRLRHLEGPETAVEALRRWLRRRGSQPATLLAMARAFPKAEPALRAALEILL